MTLVEAEVFEVVEYVDDSDWDGDDTEFERVVEIAEQVVTIYKTLVAAYEVGIGAPPPPFLTPREKVKLLQEQKFSSPSLTDEHASAAAPASTGSLPPVIPSATFQGSKPGYTFRTSPENGTGYHLDDHQLKQNPRLHQKLLQQRQAPSEDKNWYQPDGAETAIDWGGTSTDVEVDAEFPIFVPSETFQGSREGYAFRTSPENGTGYHLDEYQARRNPALMQQFQQQSQRNVAPPASDTVDPLAADGIDPPATSRHKPAVPVCRGLRAQTSKRLSTKKHLSIIDQAMIGMDSDEEILEEVIEEEEEEEIIEEEYYEEDDEIIEEEYYEEDEYEEYYDDDDYIIEEIVEEETEEEAKAREELELEIAEIERQIAEATAAKEKRVVDGGDHEETSKEKAERMAADSRLQACKQQKEKNDFKRKAAARAKVLLEREKNWSKKGRKKQKDLSEIIAAKAKKQKKLMARQKAAAASKKRKGAAQGGAAKPAEVANTAAPAAAAEEEVMTGTAQTEGKQLSMAEMLAKKIQQGIKGQEVGKAKASQDVKSAAADDFGDEDLKLEDFLPSDEEEEEDEPELTPEQAHQKSLQWEKPAWTQAQLKTTTKGNKIKAGKYLSAPITNIPKKINEGLEEEDGDNTPSQAALMKGAQKMIQLPKVKKHHAGLKFTGNGVRIRDGRKIEKQINPKVKNKEEVKIWGADPEDLKLTPRGLTARKGKILSEDITTATQVKKHTFEKPKWAKWDKTYLLKTTETGEHLKEGEDIAPKITDTSEVKKHTFEKPSWAKAGGAAALKTTEEGQKVKEGAYLSAPIVDLKKKTMNVNMEANPAFLRMTDQGEKLMEEGNLEGPITAAPSLSKRR